MNAPERLPLPATSKDARMFHNHSAHAAIERDKRAA